MDNYKDFTSHLYGRWVDLVKREASNHNQGLEALTRWKTPSTEEIVLPSAPLEEVNIVVNPPNQRRYLKEPSQTMCGSKGNNRNEESKMLQRKRN